MKIDWTKKGLIYVPDGKGFFKTHASRPIPYQFDNKILRLFMSSRDHDDRPLPTYIDVDIEDPSRVLFVCQEPLLELGRIGTFDDSGITPSCILEHEGQEFVYYSGWKRRRVNVTFELSIGICYINSLTNKFERVFEGPILSQDKSHPILVAGPFVMYDQDRFKMWYCSGSEWRTTNTGPEPIYRVHYAESSNGIDWSQFAKPVIDYKYDGEVISAPWVLKINQKYHMWYSTRGSATKTAKNYRIGYAESDDGIDWVRMDHLAGIETSDSGWDSEMVCYPSFFSYANVTYMFYSGNGVGKGGVGYSDAPRFF